jgi:ribosome-associated protein
LFLSRKKDIIKRYHIGLEKGKSLLEKTIYLTTPYITLGQLLKIADIISSGGQAKYFLADYQVVINGQVDQRRGRKLYPDDVVEIQEFGTFIMKAGK